MKKPRYLLVLFVMSLLLLLPLIAPNVEERVFPFQPKFITMNVKSPTIEISTNVQVDVTLNLTYYDPVSDRIHSIGNITIFQEITLDLIETGIYTFRFFSVLLTDIQINQVGIPIMFPIITIILGMINIGIYFYERNFSYIAY